MRLRFDTSYVPDNLRLYVHGICFNAWYAEDDPDIKTALKGHYGKNATHNLRDLKEKVTWNAFIPLCRAIGLDLEITLDGIYAEWQHIL